MDQIVELNVGGTFFTTIRSTLCRDPSSMLACMFSGDMTPSTKDKEGRFFIDRSGEHFGTILAYLRGQQILTNCGLREEAKYYQLEGLIAGLTVLPGISVPEKALSLDHCDGVLRQDVGCDVIDAMEDALVDLWGCWAHVPRSQPVLVFARSWGDDVGKMLPVTQRDHFKEWVGSCGQNEPVATCRECSSALDLSNHSAKCPLTLCMKREEFERPICTDRWQGRIRLRCCENPDDQIRGADAANFAKILYKCYGIIVKDLRDKGFTISMSLQSRCACSNRCGLAAHITIRPIPALLQDDGPLRK